MPRWKAGPERPRHSFCWECGRRLYGRTFARVADELGHQHDVHKSCVAGREVVGGSTTEVASG
jgi:hypothetical protein